LKHAIYGLGRKSRSGGGFLQLNQSKTVTLLVALIIATVALPINGSCQSSGTAVEPDQSTASLAETLSWLRKRLPDFAAITYERDAGQDATVLVTTQQSLHLIKFDSCDVRFNKTYETLKVVGEGPDVGDQNLLEADKISTLKSSGVDLSMIDPESVTISPADATRQGAEPPSIRGKPVWVVNLKGTGTPGSTMSIAGTENFLVRDRESAMRIARAFKHAALLCRAQLSSVDDAMNAPAAKKYAQDQIDSPVAKRLTLLECWSSEDEFIESRTLTGRFPMPTESVSNFSFCWERHSDGTVYFSDSLGGWKEKQLDEADRRLGIVSGRNSLNMSEVDPSSGRIKFQLQEIDQYQDQEHESDTQYNCSPEGSKMACKEETTYNLNHEPWFNEVAHFHMHRTN
jgi:hypothetical protein